MEQTIFNPQTDLNADPYMQVNINVQSYTSDKEKIIKIKRRILEAVHCILDEERDDRNIVESDARQVL